MDAETKPIRILLVDNQNLVREGLRALIDSQEGMRVEAQADDFEEALRGVQREKPDLVLLSVYSNNSELIDRILELKSASRHLHVLLLADFDDSRQLCRAIRLGAAGVVLKDHAAATLFKAIRKVCEGEAWMDRSTTATFLKEISSGNNNGPEVAKIASLTRREREIITVLCDGSNNRQIADRLLISEMTVRNHLTSILSKLEAADRFELAIYCFRHGLAKLPAAIRSEGPQVNRPGRQAGMELRVK